MVDKWRDNHTSDDLLDDLDALEALLGPEHRFSAGSGKKSPLKARAPEPERGRRTAVNQCLPPNRQRFGPNP